MHSYSHLCVQHGLPILSWRVDRHNSIQLAIKIVKFVIKQFLEPPLTNCSLSPRISLNTRFSKTVTNYNSRYGSAYFDQFHGNNRFSVCILFTCTSREAFSALCATWVSTSDATTAKRSCVRRGGFNLTRLDGCYGDVISYTRQHGNLFTREGSTIG
jgi:hypothetical protein